MALKLYRELNNKIIIELFDRFYNRKSIPQLELCFLGPMERLGDLYYCLDSDSVNNCFQQTMMQFFIELKNKKIDTENINLENYIYRIGKKKMFDLKIAQQRLTKNTQE